MELFSLPLFFKPNFQQPILQVTHPSNLSSLEESKSIDINLKKPLAIYTCDQCDKSFKKKFKLQRHKNETHLNIKNYICTECSKEFKRPQHLKRHQLSHTNTRPYPCTFENCPQQFTCKHHLVRHITLIHEKQQIYKCTECDYSTVKKKQLNKHKLSHEKVKTDSPMCFVCTAPGCFKSFTRKPIETQGDIALETEVIQVRLVFVDVCSQMFIEQTYKKQAYQIIMKKSAHSSFTKSSRVTGNSIIRYQKAYLNSRIFDNHYDSKLHSAPFLPTRTSSQSKQFVYSDAGLSEVRIKSSKLKNYKDLFEINDLVEQHQSMSNWRQFTEYSHQQPDDTIITIEYCTNCDEHQRSTRHSEQQYLYYATSLKSAILGNYPTFKVYLKPLLFEQSDSIENISLQRRIGAFEVQMRYGMQQTILFSKLKSKQWPDVDQLVSQISQQFKKTNLLIQLKFQEQDQDLKNIEIQLTQVMTNKNRSSSYHSASTQNDPSIRQQSAQSQPINRPHLLIRQMRSSSAKEKESPIKLLTQFTDSSGRAIFMNLPIEKYQLNIKETYSNLPVNQLVSVSELINDNGAYLEIELQKPQLALIKCQVFCFQDNCDKLVPCSDVLVQLTSENEMKQLKLKEQVLGSGQYEGVADLGEFEFILVKYSYAIIRDKVIIKGGINNFTYNLQKSNCQDPKQSQSAISSKDYLQSTDQQISISLRMKSKTLKPPSAQNMRLLALLELGTISITDNLNGRPICRAVIKIFDQTLNKTSTATTNAQGQSKILQTTLQSGIITITHDDYYTNQIEYGSNKSVDLKSKSTIKLELIKRASTIQFLIQTNLQTEVYSLQGSKIQIINCTTHQPNLIHVKDIVYPNMSTTLIYIVCHKIGNIKVNVLMQSDQILTINQEIKDELQLPYHLIVGTIININGSTQFELINKLTCANYIQNCPNYSISNRRQIVQIFGQKSVEYDLFSMNSLHQSILDQNVYVDSKHSLFYKEQLLILQENKDLVGLMVNDNNEITVIYQDFKLFKNGQQMHIRLQDFNVQLEFEQVQVKLIKPDQQKVCPFGQEQIKRVTQIGNQTYCIFEGHNYVAVTSGPDLKPIGYVKFETDIIYGIDNETLLLVGDQTSLVKYVELPDGIRYKLLNQLKTHGTVTQCGIWKDHSEIILSREDGVVSFYTMELEIIDNFKVCLNSVTLHQCSSEFILVNSQELIYIICRQDTQCIIRNTFTYTESILFTYIMNDNVYLLSQYNFTIYENVMTPRLKQSEYISNWSYLSNTQYIVIRGQQLDNIRPRLSNDQISRMSIQDQDYVTRNDSEWTIKLDKSYLGQPLELLLQFNNIRKIQYPMLQVYFVNDFGITQVSEFQLLSKSKDGIWHICTFGYDGSQYFIHKLINQTYNTQIPITMGLGQFGVVLQDDDVCCSTNQNNLCISNALRLNETFRLQTLEQVSCIKYIEDHIVVGCESGSVQIYRKEKQSQFYKHLQFKYNDKKICDVIYLDGSLIICSEDRKVVMVGMSNGVLEYQETVDKSNVIVLSLLNKNQIIGGYVDGRLRIWKRERSGQSVVLSQVSTMQCIRISTMLQVPWEQSNFVVGGMDGGQMELWNVEIRKHIRSYSNGHASRILSLMCRNGQVVSGCMDGRIVFWNYQGGVVVKFIQLEYPISGLLRCSNAYVVLSKYITVYYDI